MLKRMAKAAGIITAAVIAATAVAGTANAAVSDPITIDYGGKHVTVKIYSRDNGDTKDSPMFKYADLLNRAARYKDAHPGTDVQVRFAMYTFSYDSYAGVNPDDPATYGYVKDNDFGGANSEKLVTSIWKAAAHKVHVSFLYQNDSPRETPGRVRDELAARMSEPCADGSGCHVSDYLDARKVEWGSNDGLEQMHAKYMTVNHYLGDSGGDVADTTYVTTGNIDDHMPDGTPFHNSSTNYDWVQSGTLVNGHAELAAAYNRYFQLIHDNYDQKQADFQAAVRAAHAQGTLNYDDERFSAYFYPMPTGASDGWNPVFNPIAKYVDQMGAVTGNRYLKMNMFYITKESYGQRLRDKLTAIQNAPGTDERQFRFVFQKSQADGGVDWVKNAFGPPLGKVTEAETHAKNTQFAFSGPKQYYCVTGSANLASSEVNSKANTNLVIKEFTTEHPVYNEFKKVYEYLTLG